MQLDYIYSMNILSTKNKFWESKVIEILDYMFKCTQRKSQKGTVHWVVISGKESEIGREKDMVIHFFFACFCLFYIILEIYVYHCNSFIFTLINIFIKIYPFPQSLCFHQLHTLKAREMTLQVKVPDTNSGDPSFGSGTHMVEGCNHLL